MAIAGTHEHAEEEATEERVVAQPVNELGVLEGGDKGMADQAVDAPGAAPTTIVRAESG